MVSGEDSLNGPSLPNQRMTVCYTSVYSAHTSNSLSIFSLTNIQIACHKLAHTNEYSALKGMYMQVQTSDLHEGIKCLAVSKAAKVVESL